MVADRPALPDISIRQLEYLVAVAEAPTWALAASSVGVSASALSQGLAELERRAGVELFDRHGRRRRLRATARPVLEHARQVLALTADLATWSRRLATGERGTIRLGMIDAAAVVHFPDLLRDFRDDHPDVTLHLIVEPSAALLDGLARGDLDLAVCVRPPAPAVGIDATPLLVEELAVYPPDETPVGDPPGWGPWVLFPRGSHTRDEVEAALGRLGAPVDVVAESHQPEVLREMVRLGIGWTVLPVGQAESGERALGHGRRLTSRELITATRTATIVDPAVHDLADALRRSSGAQRSPP